MLDKIMDMVGGDAIKAMTSQANITTDQAKQVLPLAKDSLQEGLMSQLTGGSGVDGVLGMFKNFAGGKSESDGLFGSIKLMFMKKIMSNMGLPESVAGLVAGSGMSSIIGSLTSKIQDHGDTDDIDKSSLMSVLGGDGIMGTIAGMMGGGSEDKNDGGIMDNIADAAKDKLSGFFGK